MSFLAGLAGAAKGIQGTADIWYKDELENLSKQEQRAWTEEMEAIRDKRRNEYAIALEDTRHARNLERDDTAYGRQKELADIEYGRKKELAAQTNQWAKEKDEMDHEQKMRETLFSEFAKSYFPDINDAGITAAINQYGGVAKEILKAENGIPAPYVEQDGKQIKNDAYEAYTFAMEKLQDLTGDRKKSTKGKSPEELMEEIDRLTEKAMGRVHAEDKMVTPPRSAPSGGSTGVDADGIPTTEGFMSDIDPDELPIITRDMKQRHDELPPGAYFKNEHGEIWRKPL